MDRVVSPRPLCLLPLTTPTKAKVLWVLKLMMKSQSPDRLAQKYGYVIVYECIKLKLCEAGILSFFKVVIGGRNKYLINGVNANNTRVQDLFCSVGLNVNNPHFLIMQVSDVSKLCGVKIDTYY